VVEQLLAQLRRQVGLAVEEQGGDVVMQRAFAAALVVEEVWLAVDEHHVARLEIPIEKIIAAGSQQKFCQTRKVVLQRLLVEGHAGEAQKIILEVVQVPGDGLAVEAGTRIADLVVDVAAGLDLKTRQRSDHFAIGIDSRGSDGRAAAVLAQEIKERGVAQVLLDIGVLAQVVGIDVGNRQAAAIKMPGELEECNVFFADGIDDADGAHARAGEPHNGAA